MRNLYWGIALVVFGSLLLLDNMGYADMGDILSDYWPLLLIAVGANILMRRRAEERERAGGAGAGPAGAGGEAELVHASNILGDVVVRSASQTFKGGSVSTLLGDARVDLTGARIADGAHELRVHGLLGSSTIILPRGTPYAITASTTFGTLTLPAEHKGGFASRVSMQSPSFATSPGRITISVSHIFGDTRVEESPPRPHDGAAA